jgi:D-glycero-alpha-D-manno-heptose-7-phosphate kinase
MTIRRYATVTATVNGSLQIEVKSDCPPGSGLGGSSAVCVAMIAATDARFGIDRDRPSLARAAVALERHHLRVAGGEQDQYAAVFGGLNLMQWDAGVEHGPTIDTLRFPPDLCDWLHLVFTGKARTDAGIQQRLTERCKSENVAALNRTMLCAREMAKALQDGDLSWFGSLLHDAWEYKKETSPGCSTPRADELYELGRKHGAIGGKLCGAGGGGYLLLCVPPEYQTRTKAAMLLADTRMEPVEFEPEGVRVEVT